MHNFLMPALLLACNELCSFPPFLPTASYRNTLPRAFKKHLNPGRLSPSPHLGMVPIIRRQSRAAVGFILLSPFQPCIHTAAPGSPGEENSKDLT